MPVYLIQCGDGPVKIGKADDPKDRLLKLQIAHYQVLHIIRTVPGGLVTERAFQDKFRRRHIRNEWYHFDPEMLTWQAPLERRELRRPTSAESRYWAKRFPKSLWEH
jgi:hypothetical protein